MVVQVALAWAVPARVPQARVRLKAMPASASQAECAWKLPEGACAKDLGLDDTIKPTHGYAKQGVGYGYNKVKGLNALIATLSTPLAAPVLAATRLRRGGVNSVRGAASFATEAIRTARACGARGVLIVRADSAYYAADVIAACRALDARFSITVRMNASVKAAVAAIAENAWRPIMYPQAVWDSEEERWISDAEIAEIEYTAFASRPKKQQGTARLIVRRVKRLNPAALPEGQGELFTAWRYHAAFTDTRLPLEDAERDHRRHAIVEQVIAELKNGPPPSRCLVSRPAS